MYPTRSWVLKSAVSAQARLLISAAAPQRTSSCSRSWAGESQVLTGLTRASGLRRRPSRNEAFRRRSSWRTSTRWSPSEQFDLVISTFALPGKDQTRRVLRTAVKALSPGGTLIVADWDRSMAALWPFDAADLTTPEEIAGQLGDLEIERREVRQIEAFTVGDPRASSGTAANVVVVRSRRPMAPDSGTER